jgi:DNA mismatch endonuclease (patch repair protein)
MADVFTPDKRSAVMARIRAKDTKPELAVRGALHRMGLRFRLHVRRLPGTPDIVLSRHKLIIEVRGCFWHGHHCLKGRKPGQNHAYWLPKLQGNIVRGRRNAARLRRMGWRVCTIWECKVRRWTDAELQRHLRSLLESRAE